MGVPGLWDLLRPAATRTSLSTLAKDAFLTNKNGLRALTVGIDASIWIFHAQNPTPYGENPFLRTIFYRITSLIQQPVLPIFVFDGPNKPSLKRNQRVAGHFGTSDHSSRQFKELLDVCGLEWWNAPGEAEAELAVMSRQGKVDAILSDDVDALLFGATCLLRNNSPTLSGAQAAAASSSKSEQRNYEVYTSESIRNTWAQRDGTTLKTEEDCRMAMILVALLAGGDYAPEGVASIGPTIAHGLAHAGMADFLRHYDPNSPAFRSALATVREDIMEELRTDQSGFLGRRYKACVSKLEDKVPHELFSATALNGYLRPATSPASDLSAGWPGFGRGEASSRRGKARNEGRGDLEGMARACERFFEWGTKELVGKKFAGESVGLFGSEIVNDARSWVRSRVTGSPRRGESSKSGARITSFFASVQPATQVSAKALHTQTHGPSASPPAYLVKVHGKRNDPTNHDLIEYRLSYRADDFTARCHDAMAGTRVHPKLLPASEKAKLGLVAAEEPGLPSSSQPVTTPKNEVRVWLPEYILQAAWPDLVRVYEDGVLAKEEAKKVKKTGGRARPKKVIKSKEDSKAFRTFFKGKAVARSVSEEEIEPIEKRTTQPKSTPPRSSTIDLTDSPDSRPAQSLRASPSIPEISKRTREPSTSSQFTTSIVTGAAPKASGSPKKATKPPRRSARLSLDEPKGNKHTPIDLCSSDEEPPQPPKPARKPRRPPAPFPMLALASGLGPPSSTRRKSRDDSPVLITSRSKTNVTPRSSQSKLDLALVKPTPTLTEKRA